MPNGVLTLGVQFGESVMIGEPGTMLQTPSGDVVQLAEPIAVTLKLSLDGPRLSFNAPREIKILRQKVYEGRHGSTNQGGESC